MVDQHGTHVAQAQPAKLLRNDSKVSAPAEVFFLTKLVKTNVTLSGKLDLEGMVCKRKNSPYRVTEKPSPHWIKVKNRRYSQAAGREELFEHA
jgi:hypothetical protein